MSEMNAFGLALRTAAAMPDVWVDREKFLMEELTFCCPRETAEEAVRTSPARAGIDRRTVDKVAKSTVGYESNKVSTLTYSAGLHAGMSMLGIVPADVTRYMAHALRIIQKLAYLYGWEEILPPEGGLDEGTADLLTLFFGVMLNVEGAAAALDELSGAEGARPTREAAAAGIKALGLSFTARQTAGALADRLPKEIFGRGISRFIPVVGGVDLGGLTYVTYKPMADRLRRYLAGARWSRAEE